MAVRTEAFGKMKDGREITRFFISNGKGMEAGVINYGAILVDLLVPDKNGQIADVVLGYDTLEPYFENGSCFGATIGPNANRIANASFVLEGKKSLQGMMGKTIFTVMQSLVITRGYGMHRLKEMV